MWRELDGGRPHERESALTRDGDARVRAIVLATFPLMILVTWPLVDAAAMPMYLGAIAWVVLANAAGYLVPWHRFPRWVEMVAPMSTIVALRLMTAPAGGLADGYAMLLLMPIVWLAIYADPPDIAFGFALTAACLLAPLADWFTYLPPQGTFRQTTFFLVLATAIVLGVRPVILPLREQIRRTRRAVDALHASQATLAHDLRNPLTTIRSLAILAQQQLDRDAHGDDRDVDATREKLGEYARVIVTSSERAERTIDGVLELSRAGDQLPWVDEVDLHALLRDLAISMTGLELRLDEAPRKLVGHPPSIARLFANLLENATVHAHAATSDEQAVTVTVRGRELATGWMLEVVDDGRGFDPGEVETLFEPWRRGASSGSSVGGLGLAIVAAIVEQHGGTISAANAEPHGAEFTFTLSRRPIVAAKKGDDDVSRAPGADTAAAPA